MLKESREQEGYKWIIVGGLFVTLVLSWGIIFNSMSIFVTPIQEDLQTTRSVMIIVMLVRGAGSVAASLVAGFLIDRFGALRVMRISVTVLILSFAAMAFMNSVAQYLVLAFIQVSATILSGFIPVSVIINGWFPGRNAGVMGAAYMGSGIGGMLFNYLGGVWIFRYGWQSTVLIMAGLMAVILLPTVFLVLRMKGRGRAMLQQTGREEGMTLEEALKTRQMWMIMLSLTIMAITLGGMVNNLTPAFQDLGYSLTDAALITSLVMISMSLGKILIGKVFARAGLKAGSITANLFMMLPLFGLIMGRHSLGVLAVILGFSLGGGFASMSVPLLTDGLFGRKDYSRISGYKQAAFNIGNIIAPLIMSPLYSVTGSYDSAWMLFAVLMALNFFIYMKFLPSRDKILYGGIPEKGPVE